MSLWVISQNRSNLFDVFYDGKKLNTSHLEHEGICINYIATYSKTFDVIVAGKNKFYVLQTPKESV